ncbi:MAG: GTP-binding protein [Candidatus Hodarchaeales archaeon]
MGRIFKLSLLGDGAVGKTSLKVRYTKGEFTNRYRQTLGVDFATHTINFDNKEVKIQIWDVAGQQVFNSIRKGFFQGSLGGWFVYDVTRPDTFQSLMSAWIEPFWETLQSKPPCILVANKVDLIEDRKVSGEDGEKFAQFLKKETGFNVPLIETSAKEGTNVNNAFETLAREVIYRADSKQKE